MNKRNCFAGIIILAIVILTTGMIVPERIIPAPTMSLSELLMKRSIVYQDISTFEASTHRKWTGVEKIIYRKIKKQFKLELKSKHLLDQCDTLAMKDGSKFKGIVTETNRSEIFYKICDDPEGPTFSIKKSQLSYIQYANGSKVEFETMKSDSVIQKKSDTETNQTDPMAIAAFAAGGVGLLSLFVSGFAGFFGLLGFFGFIAAFILGLISLRNIKRSKGKLKGKGMAIAGVVIGIGGILLIALAILLIALLIASIP